MKQTQQKVKAFCQKHNLVSPPEYSTLDTMSELGEVAKELLKMTDYGRRPMQFREEIKTELGDVLYSLITLANSLDVDVEEALDTALEKYEKRLEKGSAGSED